MNFLNKNNLIEQANIKTANEQNILQEHITIFKKFTKFKRFLLKKIN